MGTDSNGNGALPGAGDIISSGSRGAISIAGYLLSAASLLWIVQAALLAYAVQKIVDGGGVSQAIWPAGLFVLIGLAKSLLEAAGNRLAFRHARRQLSALRQAAVLAMSRRSPVDPGRLSSGEVASILGEQAELVVPYYSRFVPARLRSVIVPLVILLFVLPVSWLTALLLLIAAPLIPLFMALIGVRAQAESERQLVAMGGLNGFLLDRLRGLSTLRSLGAVETTALELRSNAETLKARTMAVLKIAFLSSAVLELFSALGVAMVAVYVGFSLLGEIRFGTWGAPLTLESGLFMLLLAPAFFEPLRDLSAAWHDRAAGKAAIEALARLGAAAAPADLALPEMPIDPKMEISAAIVAEGLCFRYGEQRPLVLDHVDLRIAAGEHVALVGPSGAGKSTLLAALAGLAVPEAGRISIGGVPLTAATAGVLRQQIAWIGQKPHIFAGSIVRNIALGRPDIDAGAIGRAVDTARLGQVARGYGNRPLGEGGIGLSGGEAVRLAIARAAASPGIRIILADEPTAHLDSVTAQEVADSLLALAEDSTLIVATHDPELAARMDRIVDIAWQPMQEAAE